MNVALVCIAKNEEKYLHDWITYHYHKGFQNIIICDNEQINNNTQKLICEQYDYVIYEDYRDKIAYQTKCYSEIYLKYKHKYDWICFWDVDEFLYLETHKTISELIKSILSINNKANLIFLNWKCFGDSGHITYTDIPVYERFTVPYPKDIYDPSWKKHKINTHIKSIVKTCSSAITFIVPHNAMHKNVTNVPVNATGKLCSYTSPWQPICWTNAWLNHYCTLTIDEFFSRRLSRGRATTTKKRTPQELCDYFFAFNSNTPNKMKILKKYFNNIKIKDVK